MKNNELIEKVVKLVAEERRIGVEVLELLQEIESRKAYAELNYDSLFSFCTKKLGYTDAQAARRIQAMRAVSEHPELKEKITEGLLTVTTVSQVQTHLRKKQSSGEIQTKAEKMELFTAFESHSAKEVEIKLSDLSGEETLFTLILKLNPEMKEAWDKIKNLSAHSTRGQDSEILNLLMKEWLKKSDPDEKIKGTKGADASENLLHFLKNVATHQSNNGRRRFIPTHLKRIVWKRDGGRCANCGSSFAIQYDHIQPFAKGGEHSTENLRLLCRSCNLHAGIQEYGGAKMQRMPHEGPH